MTDDIGTVRWFGETWNAPVNDPRSHIPTPVGERCVCGLSIHADDEGIRVISSPDGFAYYHLLCFWREIGVVD